MLTETNPTERWHLLDSGAGTPAWNMALDEALMEAAPQIGPVLRFYAWTEPAASFGYFQRIAEIERVTALRPLVRRPTAGGLVPHDADWTYSVVIPPAAVWHRLRAEQSYERMHRWIAAAFARLGVTTELAPEARKEIPGQCFAGYEKHDLLRLGRKIAGAAQRRTRRGLLIQGSVQPPPRGLNRPQWHQAMCAVAAADWGIEWDAFKPGAELIESALLLVISKYSVPGYNRRR